ncbi:tropinone reductase homolog At5g06060-like isoform X2 [Zingiber officinale]|uniref:tropinone reductase homolog At5g06060-like isoform X2 n=1 Tax=Zingiber officinale TaxID=94328 RepID=UPI001C4D819D|nr:tropinone reductase homolog At5g06060-like isoform X2 [Zingiber officinale]
MTMEEIKEPLMGDEEMPPLLEDQETDAKPHYIALFVESLPSLLEVTQEEYKHIMNTNLEADFHLSQLAHTLLKASGQGNIIFISLIAGLEGYSSLYVYGSSKATLKQLQKLSPEFHCCRDGRTF